MKSSLQSIRKKLTQQVIQNYWTKHTKDNPKACVQHGISVNFNESFTTSHAKRIANSLLRCFVRGQKTLAVATPIFQYNYDVKNDLPNHISAITLFITPKFLCLNYFNPQGNGTVRKAEEQRMLKLIGHELKQKTGVDVHTYIYFGRNIQSRDNIGLCQLFSLLYLHEFLNNPSCCSPTAFLAQIKKRHNGLTQKTILQFWNQHVKQFI